MLTAICAVALVRGLSLTLLVSSRVEDRVVAGTPAFLCRWTRQTTFGPFLNTSIGGLETEERVREERGLFHEQCNSGSRCHSSFTRKKCFCRIPEQQCSMKLDLSSAWTSYIVALLNFLKDVHARMPTLSCAAERASPGA